VEITARGRGPVVRGEACADSFYAAFESAVSKLENRLRRSKDRRKIHYGDKRPVSVAEATAAAALVEAQAESAGDEAIRDGAELDGLDDHEPGRIVRTKTHPATPMTVDDALSQEKARSAAMLPFKAVGGSSWQIRRVIQHREPSTRRLRPPK
jgi:AraC-like DNA-binding protein